MSILIKGMEMPKSCGKCKLFDASHAIGLFSPLGWCRVNGKEIFRLSKKADFCPLVPVQPHGRLGDLDELAKRIEHERYNHTHTDGLAARHHIAEYGHFLNAIAAAPTVIPAEGGMDSDDN